MGKSTDQKGNHMNSINLLIKAKLFIHTRMWLWCVVILLALPLPAAIEFVMAKFVWGKDLSNVKVSFLCMEDIGNTVRKPTRKEPIEITLDEIKTEIAKELEAGRGPSVLKSKYKKGDSLEAKYTISSWNPSIKVFLLVFPPIILALAFGKFNKSLKSYKISLSTEPDIENLIAQHGDWFKKYGLVKIRVDNPHQRTDYYKTLELIAEGYKAIYGTKDESDNMYLFLKGNLGNIHRLATKDPNKVEVKKLYKLFNKLANKSEENKLPKYNVIRGLICTSQEYESAKAEHDSWHTSEYPNVENKWIDYENPNVQTFIQLIGDQDCDFAIFENVHQANLLCVGFYAGRVTFVLLDGLDELGIRRGLFLFSKENYFS